ncbi:hypothetical protein KAX22_09750, partial [bacterium]|nr:hypothetical protein [bacterium]
PDDLLLDVKEHPSPLALIQGGAPDPLILLAAAIVLRYSDAPQDRTVTVTATENGQVREIPQMACGPEQTRDLMI